MGPFANLRLLACARRCARALESIARSQSELAEAARNDRLQREAKAARVPRKTEIGQLDLKAAEKRWRESRPDLDDGDAPGWQRPDDPEGPS